MKSQIHTQPKPNLTKKPSTKALNQKKNSTLLDSTLKKQKSKPNLTLTHPQQPTQTTTNSNFHKLTSPKNTLNNHSVSMMVTTKTQPTEEFIKHQKTQLNKKTLPTNKIRKTGLSKHQPIKKQFLSNLRSPKNLKSNLVQSQIFLTSQKQHSQNGQNQLNIQLDTSIIKTQHFDDQISQNQHQSHIQGSFLKQNSTKTIFTLQQSQIQELTKTSKQQNQEILKLKNQNQELERKLNKMKSIQDQHKKKLRERISTFNEQGEEIKQLKEKILNLEKQIQDLILENHKIKNNINQNIQDGKLITKKQSQKVQEIIRNTQRQQMLKKKSQFEIFSVMNFEIVPLMQGYKERQKGMMIDESVMTSFEDSICDGVLSFINGNSLGNLQQSLLSNEKPKDFSSESCQLIGSLQIETIKNSYEQKYREKINMMENKYRQGLKDVQNRVGLFQRESKEIVRSQQEEILSLQKKIDELYEKLQECRQEGRSIKSKKGPCIDIDDRELKHMMEINSYKKKLSIKDQQLKKTHQQIHIKQIQCKRICAQLDIERIKHSLNTQVSLLNKQIIQLSQNQQVQIILQQLKTQKQKNIKLSSQNQKKQELIKKLSTFHQNTINKKIKK